MTGLIFLCFNIESRKRPRSVFYMERAEGQREFTENIFLPLKSRLCSLIRDETKLDLLESQGIVNEKRYKQLLDDLLIDRDFMLLEFAKSIVRNSIEPLRDIANQVISKMDEEGSLSDQIAFDFFVRTGLTDNLEREN